jgi:predicted nucleotide-binding protein
LYNLMVTAGENYWELGEYVWENDRILEHTADEFKQRFAALDTKTFEQLATLPTLFMYERGTVGTARVGTIKTVQLRGGNRSRIVFAFDEGVRAISTDELTTLADLLDIGRWEFTRTHWAVKDVDLHQVLRNAGIIVEAANGAAPHGTANPRVSSERIFVVHGRDEGKKHTVARFLESKVGLKVCVLSEQPSRGRTIITKFQEEAAGANYAVVVMSADDVGSLRPELNGHRTAPLNSRSRQNVIFELGFFLGKLGVDRVCVLLDDGVEKPSDYDGVVYIPFDQHDGWQRRLVSELQAANVTVSPTWWSD